MNNSVARGPRRVLALLALMLVALLLLVACGSGGDASSGDLEARTAEIARTFAASGDMETARASLQGLGVANPLQWLIYQTESAISSNNDPELTRAYVTMALEMDVRESTIRTWAQANGLVQPSEATAASGGATLAAAVLQPVPTVAPTQAPMLADAAPPVTAAGAITTTGALSAAAGTGAQTDSSTAAAAGGPNAAPDAAPDAAPTTAPTVAPARLTVAQLVNLREGPGTAYNLAGALAPGETAEIVAKDSAGEWWQVRMANGGDAWVYAALATAAGDTSQVAIAANIPTPPPATATAVTAPVEAVAAAPTTAPAAAPEAPTAAPAANPSDQPHFTLVERRMWSKEENGACAGQHLLRIIVLDANGAPLNGVTLQGIYTGEQITTGAQGKGDGRIEYDLYGTGEGFRVIRNNDGRDASSDNAEGFTTKSLDIDVPTLIQGGYCSDEADCQIFYNSWGCTGHHSWQATFKRNY